MVISEGWLKSYAIWLTACFLHHLPAFNGCKSEGEIWLLFDFDATSFSHKQHQFCQRWANAGFLTPLISLSRKPCLSLCMFEVMYCRILLNFVADNPYTKEPANSSWKEWKENLIKYYNTTWLTELNIGLEIFFLISHSFLLKVQWSICSLS